MRNTRQSSKSIIAAVVTTPLPPRKPKYSGYMWPIMQQKPAAYMPSAPFRVYAVCNARVLYKKIADQNARNTLAEIEQKRQRRGFFARHAQHVRCTRVAAAVRAHIFVRKRFGQQNGKADTAKQIPHKR